MFSIETEKIGCVYIHIYIWRERLVYFKELAHGCGSWQVRNLQDRLVGRKTQEGVGVPV